MKDRGTRTLQMITSFTLILFLVGGFLWASREASITVARSASQGGSLGGLEVLAVALYVFILLFPFTLLLALVLVVGAIKLVVMAAERPRALTGARQTAFADLPERVEAGGPRTPARAA
jgi:hypothetical protein